MTAPQDDPLASWSETWGKDMHAHAFTRNRYDRAVQALASRVQCADEFAPQHATLFLRLLDKLGESARMERAVLTVLEAAAGMDEEDLS